MLRVIDTARPRFALGENVFGIVNMGLDGVLADLEAIGYTAGAVVIPAGAVNALHRRDRVWIMAHRDGSDTPNGGQRATATGEGGERRDNGGGGDSDAWQVSDGSARQDTERMADTHGAGQREQCWTEPVQSQHGATEHRSSERTGTEVARALDPRIDGLSPELVRRSWADGTWELDLPRVVAHEPERRQKLMAAGNAIVPQVAYEILKVMIGEAA